MRSMTGYGEVTGEIDGRSIDVILKSTNHKHFVFSPYLPEGLRPFEPKFEQVLGEYIDRGRVHLHIQANIPLNSRSILFRKDRIKQYLEQLDDLKQEFSLSGSPSLELLVELPGVVREEEDADREWVRAHLDDIKSTVEEAAKKLIESRKREGKKLQKGLRRDFEEFQESFDFVRSSAPEAIEEYQQELSEKIDQFHEDTGKKVNKERLYEKIWSYIEKYDIQEELDRLESHVEEFQNVFEKDEPIGRKADFIAQEIMRETNTIAAKNKHPDLNSHLLTMKSSVKSLREQLQNIE